jgi:hypothetical protein
MALACTQSACGFYNPSAGRWLSRDPIGEPGGENLHCFVKNAPAAAFDPVGLCRGVSCPCELAKLLRDDPVAAHAMIAQNIDFGNTPGHARMRILNDFRLLAKEGGSLGFALAARTACGSKLKVRAVEKTDVHYEAGWMPGSEELQLNAYTEYPHYMYLDYETEQFLGNYRQSGAIIIGHELGHAYMGIIDPYNVYAVENQIRKAFGVSRRPRYNPSTQDRPDMRSDGRGLEYPGGTLGGLGIARPVEAADYWTRLRMAFSTVTAFTAQWGCQ